MSTRTRAEIVRLKADAKLAVLLASDEVLRAPSPSLGVAKFLRTRQIRGERTPWEKSPIANYLRDCLDGCTDPEIMLKGRGREIVFTWKDGQLTESTYVGVPDAVFWFDRDMDEGVYPDLDPEYGYDGEYTSGNHYIVEPTQPGGREYTVWRVNCIRQRWFIASYAGAHTAVRLCSVMNQFAHTEVV